MADIDDEIEARFTKLMLSSTLKTMGVLHGDVDVLATVRGHMLEVCSGVRERALASAGDSLSPEEATAHVDQLIRMIEEYFEYSASPMFPPVKLVKAR